MPKGCCVVGCTNNSKTSSHLSFYKIPNEATEPERRNLWIQAIRREDEHGNLWVPKSNYNYVCSSHFILGKKADEKDHPDYVPSCFPSRPVSKSPALKLQRFNNKRRRAMPSFEDGRAGKLFCSSLFDGHSSSADSALQGSPAADIEIPPSNSLEDVSIPLATDNPVSSTSALNQPVEESEREQLYYEMSSLREERDKARAEVLNLEVKLSKAVLNADSVKGNDTKCKLMTGLTWDVFMSLLMYLTDFIKPSNHKRFKLNTKDQLFVSLIKLRQNPSNDILGHILDLGRTTILDMFHRWLGLMYSKISFLIHWPARDVIFKTLPPHFRAIFPRLTCLVDCFEIRIDHPKKPKARAKTYSHYKKWTTVKYFIACHPAGAITYLSHGWGGRASDVEIVRKSDFITNKYHYPGDQILADRGFTLSDDFATNVSAELIMPAFTKGKKQMPGKDVEESRMKAHVRIHIERVIGVLKNRYHILDGPLPVPLVKSMKDESEHYDIATIDKIVHVCAALVNMGGGVVYNEDP